MMRIAILGITLLAMWPDTAIAQVKVASAIVHEQTKGKGGRTIEVVFEESFSTEESVVQARTEANYRLVDLVDLRDISVTVSVERLDLGLPDKEVPLVLSTSVELEASEELASVEGRYVLLVSGLTFGKKLVVPGPVAVSFVAVDATPAGLLSVQLTKAKDREAADLFLSGEFARSAGEDFFGTVDVKLKYPFAEPVWAERIHVFSPLFDLKASSNPKADPDTAKAGLSWQWFPIVIPKGGLPTTQWENYVGLEASKDFDTRNLVWQTVITFMPRSVSLGVGELRVDPAIGLEFGRTLKAQSSDGEGLTLGRGLLGVSGTLTSAELVGKRLTLNAVWQLRRLFNEEQFEGLALERGDHQWRSLKLDLQLTDYLSLGVTYEDGGQPPKFKLVDGSLKIGLTYKAGFKPQPVR